MSHVLVVDHEGWTKGGRAADDWERLEALVAARTRSLERLRKRLRTVMDGSIRALSAAAEMRDPYTAGHERRVADLASAIAGRLGLGARRTEGVRVMGFLHDLGKMSIPTEILSKPGKLNTFEFGLIKSHPKAGAEILGQMEFSWPVGPAILQHHERMDGSGYPNGLKGDQIILEARILAVADVVEAMSSHRPYRPAFSIEAALGEVEKGGGCKYDEAVVATCCRLFKEEGFQFA